LSRKKEGACEKTRRKTPSGKKPLREVAPRYGGGRGGDGFAGMLPKARGLEKNLAWRRPETGAKRKERQRPFPGGERGKVGSSTASCKKRFHGREEHAADGRGDWKNGMRREPDTIFRAEKKRKEAIFAKPLKNSCRGGSWGKK